jgi:hypothetical protein
MVARAGRPPRDDVGGLHGGESVDIGQAVEGRVWGGGRGRGRSVWSLVAPWADIAGAVLEIAFGAKRAQWAACWGIVVLWVVPRLLVVG